MELTTIIARGEEFLASEIDGEIVMMNINTGTYVSLNSTRKSIWNLLVTPLSIDSIINALTEEYDISKEDCQKDTTPFIEQMITQKIVIKN